MPPVRNSKLYLKKSVPAGQYPIPGENLAYGESDTIDLDQVSLKQGEILLKVLYASLDPYMRGRMRSGGKSYSAPFEEGRPIDGGAVSVVIKSNNTKFKEGTYVVGATPYVEYAVVDGQGFYPVPDVPGVSKSAFIGVLGMPGLTAYCGLKEYGELKKGETVFVSTGAGAVGSLVIQLAKLWGAGKVIGSASSDDKVEYMKSIGADVAFNYTTQSTADILEKEGPIDVYWDNVGGQTLEAVLNNANLHGRIIVCGMASQYNAEPYPIKNLMQFISKRLKMVGFLVNDLRPKYTQEFFAEVPKLVAEGKFQFKEHITEGYKSGPDALLALLKGENTGKAVIKVAEN